MRRWILAAALMAVPVVARAQAVQQSLVDRATLAVQEMLTVKDPAERLATLRKARAAMVCPRVFQAGFVIGGSGGGCVLVARDGAGSWSSPAFYSMGSASLGLQIGIQDSEVMMLIMTDRGLDAIMDNQFKIGGDASIAVATIGSGVEGSSSGALHADIIAYAQPRGLYAGVTLSGSTLTTDTPANQAYYGKALAARQLVMQMEANNPGADPLRAALGKFGGPVLASAAPVMPVQQSFDDESQPPPVQHHRVVRRVASTVPPVQSEALPPPPPPPPRR